MALLEEYNLIRAHLSRLKHSFVAATFILTHKLYKFLIMLAQQRGQTFFTYICLITNVHF